MEKNLIFSINADGELGVVDDGLYTKLVSFCVLMGGVEEMPGIV